MPISRMEYQIKMLAYSLLRYAIQSPEEIEERVADNALEIFVRVPGLKHEHDAAQDLRHALKRLGEVSSDDVNNKARLRSEAWDVFESLDMTFDHNRTYDHYSALEPTFILFKEENRV